MIKLKVYLNPKAIGTSRFEKLKVSFSNVTFITEISKSKEAEVLIVMPNFFFEANLDDYPNVKWIQLLMAGYDTFDFSKISGRNIIVSIASDIFSKSIAEDVMIKVLILNRNTRHYLKSMEEGNWAPIQDELELTNSTVGILGCGSIGKEVAKRMKAFDTKVIGYKQKREAVPFFDEIYTGIDGLEKVVSLSDYLIVALPLSNKTKNLINEQRIGLMKENAIFINVARGGIVDQEALYQALVLKKIRGAGLDVTTPEPLPKNHPLWKLENVFITPHNASSSPFMQPRMTELIEKNLKLYLQGKDVVFQITQ